MPSRSKDDTSGLRVLGQGSLHAPASGPAIELLEAFPNQFPGRNYLVSISFPEFTSLCPMTGQPDFGTICVDYIPDHYCVESKSFKLYMFAYRNHQSFMETITNNILDDLVKLLAPRWCKVSGLFAPRGGTRINVSAEYFKELEPELALTVKEAVLWLKNNSRNDQTT